MGDVVNARIVEQLAAVARAVATAFAVTAIAVTAITVDAIAQEVPAKRLQEIYAMTPAQMGATGAFTRSPLVPAAQPPHKGGQPVSRGTDRLLMTRLRRYTDVEKKAEQRWSDNCRMDKPPGFTKSKADESLDLPDPSEEVLGG